MISELDSTPSNVLDALRPTVEANESKKLQKETDSDVKGSMILKQASVSSSTTEDVLGPKQATECELLWTKEEYGSTVKVRVMLNQMEEAPSCLLYVHEVKQTTTHNDIKETSLADDVGLQQEAMSSTCNAAHILGPNQRTENNVKQKGEITSLISEKSALTQHEFGERRVEDRRFSVLQQLTDLSVADGVESKQGPGSAIKDAIMLRKVSAAESMVDLLGSKQVAGNDAKSTAETSPAAHDGVILKKESSTLGKEGVLRTKQAVLDGGLIAKESTYSVVKYVKWQQASMADEAENVPESKQEKEDDIDSANETGFIATDTKQTDTAVEHLKNDEAKASEELSLTTDHSNTTYPATFRCDRTDSLVDRRSNQLRLRWFPINRPPGPYGNRSPLPFCSRPPPPGMFMRPYLMRPPFYGRPPWPPFPRPSFTRPPPPPPPPFRPYWGRPNY
jgi:hypothetical protein